MAAAVDLLEYLKTMEQMGMSGLRLNASPFVLAPTESARPASAPIKRGAPPPARQAPKAAPVQEAKPKGPDLFSIMGKVHAESEAAGAQAKIDAITAEDPVAVLRDLYKAFRGCELCALGTTRNRFVFGEGPPNADLMFVGEGPGEDEDRSGRPFVGAAGQLLTRIISAMGLQRNDVFIANVVKCRPPGNRTPLPDETEACSPILQKQIDTVKPKVIVALGATAYRHFKGGAASITRDRGQFIEWRGYAVMPTFHPAYILRNPRSKKEVWTDMQEVMARLKQS